MRVEEHFHFACITPPSRSVPEETPGSCSFTHRSVQDLFIHSERARERQRHRQREKQAPCRKPNVGLDPGSPGSHPGLQAVPNRCTTGAALKINTEEHVDAADQEVILWDHKIPEDILKEIATPKEVPAESVTVWIDPLDATQEYTEDLRKYVTTMVCVAVNGKPVLGVIHKPFSEYTAWAMVDGGSNVKARTSYNEKTPRIIVSRSHSGMVKQVALQTFGNQTTIIPAGGAGYKVLALLDVPDKSQEKADLYIHVTYIKKWDICAGNAILKALGGHMTTLSGEEISYTGSDGIEGGLLASIRMNHQALVRKLPDLDKTGHK
ncbi:Golgi-resident adenosine 3',5'-bisphosphate 3'-phosphatase isoform X3 [Canis lupus dingo]|uniref:Golgi-resident adenosine 3',5'-bisphosphate 3'-phosphatase isoform X3 n=1 Tax=Canis lupus dingo TaxID=286419 RepID=UPI0020C1EA6F|nr:Golgi-resident adenosine 3',5'-bisphosphate 3'-phosphatase isoform X3 [Canis lupus dingo]XP_048959652.1 Golgi-resident adenosine 3',5'-bisphosphate 3'-phosphatase isoform X3 [Canis lupus dingo]XP_048959653.1 Golgi-resident adenosine 3',5'-bisphosphate 3'-phosphatase isoform X3 [Canis lupus dingo]XP_048959654.1 Golgi-resident adenosine 3',5'-bisphosphate 3'-phosphatase isoform X3 [Canis lupus dingo]XP_048959655.1 Golgi-resident adenosine 3',5'-bisphosphate 3'-phosphatase isoform X3 [Canis lup